MEMAQIVFKNEMLGCALCNLFTEKIFSEGFSTRNSLQDSEKLSLCKL